MKRYYIIISILLMSTMVGCSSNLNARFGKIDGDKYVNRYYGFTMDIPQNYETSSNIEKMNGSEKIAVDAEEVIVFSAKISGEKISKILEEHKSSISGMTVLALNKNKTASSSEFHNKKSEDEAVNSKSIINKYINGKEFAVLDYENGRVYYTDCNDSIIEFNFANFNKDNNSIEDIIHSVNFE